MTRYLQTLAIDVAVFLLLGFTWGIPVLAVLDDTQGTDSPLLTGFADTAGIVVFLGLFLTAQIVVYAALAVRWPSRRVAVLTAPLAVGILYVFAARVLTGLLLAIWTLLIGASSWVPGRPPWWHVRPALVVAYGLVFALVTAAAQAVETQKGPVRTSLDFLVHDHGRRAHFRLECRYNRAGGAVASPREMDGGERPHPGGLRACRILDSERDVIQEGTHVFERGCPPRARWATVAGTYYGKPFRGGRISTGNCDEAYFIADEAAVLVPALSTSS
jgi:hypothetical protein